VSNVVIATARDALGAAARAAEQAGIRVIALGASVTGEARDVGAAHAARAREMQRGSGGPCLLLSGGETTVTVSGNGRGGRNGEYLLSFALALKGSGGIWAIACDTDGIDGTEDSAGALLDPYTLQRAWARNLDAAAALARNDSYSVFEAAGDLVRTGPTRTNVNDFRAILIVPRYP
jgi:hydroxypyruvate reductase